MHNIHHESYHLIIFELLSSNHKKNWRYGSPGSATIKLSVIDNNTIDADVQEGGSLLYDIKSYPKVVIGDGHIEKLEY